jgi:proline dehydrogenase
MIFFENSEIAFKHLKYSQLRKTYWLFKIMSFPNIVNIGKILLNTAIKLHLPVAWIVKPTIFKQFCGGESLSEAAKTIAFLNQYNVKAILDYSVEGDNSEISFEAALQETLATIHFASKNPNVPFTVFKPSAFGKREILEKVSSNEQLTNSESEANERFKSRIENICKTAFDENIPVMIDAEHSYYQQAIDDICEKMMEKYNLNSAIVYNTLQMYRTDRLNFLKNSLSKANLKGYYLGIKFVRGAYMEKERERALQLGYTSPIHINKLETDSDFNKALQYSIDHIDRISIFCGTHNESSNLLLTKLITEYKFAKNDSRIWFSQLYGMSDNISFNLANDGYNVTKYIPYGPIKQVMPYLIRRAEENTSVKGQTSRELQLINLEMIRRKK